MDCRRTHPFDCGQPLADRALADVLDASFQIGDKHRLQGQRAERGEAVDDGVDRQTRRVEVPQRERVAAIELHVPLIDRAQRTPHIVVHAGC